MLPNATQIFAASTLQKEKMREHRQSRNAASRRGNDGREEKKVGDVAGGDHERKEAKNAKEEKGNLLSIDITPRFA